MGTGQAKTAGKFNQWKKPLADRLRNVKWPELYIELAYYSGAPPLCHGERRAPCNPTHGDKQAKSEFTTNFDYEPRRE